MEGDSCIMIQKGVGKNSRPEGYMQTVRIFFLFGNISEQFGYERVI